MAVQRRLISSYRRTALHCCVIGFFFLGPSCCPAYTAEPWVTLERCQYLIKRANDGDSFHVSVAGHEYIFRLYFVDAPETRTDFRDRVEEQARYFNTSVNQLLEIGELAKQFTRERLSKPFVIRTCWEDAMGRSRMQRFYAFVQTQSGDLGEQLVENGLARIHAPSVKPVGLSSAQVEWRRILKLEKKARAEKVGGWGVNVNRLFVRAQDAQSELGFDPFGKFFHPSEMAQNSAGSTAVSDTSPSRDKALVPDDSTSPASQPKLNVNTASKAELENISGVGPVLAERIIAARPLKGADELRNIKGIGDVKYVRIRPYFE